MVAEGWYRDPYGLHTDRWFSVGRATDLVRDGGVDCQVESHDDPPPGEPPFVLVPADEHEAPHDGSDLRRADELTRVDQSAPDVRGCVRIVLSNTDPLTLFRKISDVRRRD